jgi:outer membrane protein assembly factor BamA
MKCIHVIVIFLVFFGIANDAVAQDDSAKYVPISPDSLKISDTSSKPLYIASISIYGNKKTKPFIIEREIPFKQGDYLSPADLEKQLVVAKQQLVNTSLFLEVSVFIQNKFGELVFITVSVRERWYLFPLPYFKLADRNFNTWWVTYDHSFQRVNYGVKFLHNNISGRNDKFTVWLITGYSRQFALKYERPFVDRNLHYGYNVYTSYTRQRELNYGTSQNVQKFFKPDSLFFVRRAFNVEADYVYRPALHTKHVFRFQYAGEKVADTIIALNPNYFPEGKTEISYPEIGYNIQYQHADYNMYPTKGFLGEARILHRGFNSDVNVTQLQLLSTYTIPLFTKTQLQLKEGASISVPFNQPFYNKRLFGYGQIFMRGLEYYVIDGVAGGVGRATLQHQFLQFNTRLAPGTKKEVNLPFRFFAKLYTDVGYAYDKNPSNSMLNNKLLHTWGFGLDVVAVYDIIFKFDYSFNQFGESGLYIHVRTDF